MLITYGPRSTEHGGLSVAPCFVFLCFRVVSWLACAPKAPPAVVGAPKHPDFVFPAVPDGTKPEQASRIDRGWKYLQLDDHRNAEREFAAALKQQPSFHPAETAMAYLALARGNETRRRDPVRSRAARGRRLCPGARRQGAGDARARSRRGRAGELRGGAREGPVAHRPAQPRRRVEVPRDPGLAGAREGGRGCASMGRGRVDLPAGDRGVAGVGISLSRPGRGRAARGAIRECARALPESRGDRPRRCALARGDCGDPREPGRRGRRAGGLRAGPRHRSGRGPGGGRCRACAPPPLLPSSRRSIARFRPVPR